MRPHISIAFDKASAMITFWNGLQPNHPQHISKMVGLPLTEFNKLLANRNFFYEMFKIKPTPHIANELKSCLGGFKKVEIDPSAMAELVAMTKTEKELQEDVEVVAPLIDSIEREIQGKAAVKQDGSMPEDAVDTLVDDPAALAKTEAELEELRTEAKALGIKGAHLMKPETLIEKIKIAKGE